MTITVGIATRNRSNQLERCLLSLTKQKSLPHQIFIVDNNSSDNTKNIISSFNNRLPIHYEVEKRIGLSYARNRLLKKIKTDIFASIDDDCEATPNWVENIINAHNQYPHAVAIQGLPISFPKKSIISIITQFNFEAGLKDSLISGKNFSLKNKSLTKPSRVLLIDAKNVSFKIKIIKKLGICFETPWKYGEDFYFAKRLLSLGQIIIFYPKIKIYHWERSDVKSFLVQRFLSGRSVKYAYNRWSSFFPKRKGPWWLGRISYFFAFITKNGYFKQLPLLIFLFFVEKCVYIGGGLFEQLSSLKK